ncbi:aminoglycoside phosphotransferase family protein [Actinoplanes sichuanensis]|uniref:Aminoglycoside phosphotransferase family protein n=1 Tax=Actinoplanes sichuanensis TaxID=512349 RepID=A0ABW4AJ88_9ACTN|nr:aminoglycoside phosphotransferase family protein [Actinoplanes sichuanensis]BEL03721.1 aminoglycoside phosphotransferase family protein [Actinoplanes sichuanensis]
MGGFTVPRSFLESPRWWRGGGEWLAGLAEAVREQCARWRLTIDGAPAHGSNALVVPVIREGEGFVLRLTPPGPDVAELIAALRFWDGRGTVRLVDADAEAGVMLLERLSATSLNDVPVDEAMHELGVVMDRLAVPAPDHVPDTGTAVARRMATMPQEWERLGRPFDGRILDETLVIGQRLSLAAGDDAVNGDLHAEQVLRGGREPWLVVDPVLMRGDRAFDLGRVLWTRLDEMPRPDDVVRCFDIVVRAAGVEPAHGRDWVLYRAVDYWLWGLGAGLTEDPVRCHRLVSVFRA